MLIKKIDGSKRQYRAIYEGEVHEELLSTKKDEVGKLGNCDLFLPASETKLKIEGAEKSLEQIALSQNTLQPLSLKTKSQCLKINEKRGNFVPWCLETLFVVFFFPLIGLLYTKKP